MPSESPLARPRPSGLSIPACAGAMGLVGLRQGLKSALSDTKFSDRNSHGEFSAENSRRVPDQLAGAVPGRQP